MLGLGSTRARHLSLRLGSGSKILGSNFFQAEPPDLFYEDVGNPDEKPKPKPKSKQILKKIKKPGKKCNFLSFRRSAIDWHEISAASHHHYLVDRC